MADRTLTPKELSEQTGEAIEQLAVRRFWEAAGLSAQGEVLYEEDVRVLKAFVVAEQAGFPEEALLQRLDAKGNGDPPCGGGCRRVAAPGALPQAHCRRDGARAADDAAVSPLRESVPGTG